MYCISTIETNLLITRIIVLQIYLDDPLEFGGRHLNDRSVVSLRDAQMLLVQIHQLHFVVSNFLLQTITVKLDFNEQNIQSQMTTQVITNKFCRSRAARYNKI